MDVQRVSAVIPLCRKTGRVLLLHRCEGRDSQYPAMWEIPGGKANDMESDEAAACRELFEETRLKEPIIADVGSLSVWQEDASLPKPRLVVITFFVALMEDEISPVFPKQNPEHNRYCWLSQDQVQQNLSKILPFNVSVLHAAFALHRVYRLM